MGRKLIMTVVAVMLTLALAGGAIAATPSLQQGEGLRVGRMLGSMAARVADFLGMEVREVIQARSEGETFADILDDKLDAFVEATVTERQAIIDKLLVEGKITADQAAFCRNLSTERLQDRLQSTFEGRGDGEFRGGVRRFMQNMRGRMQRIRQQNKAPVLNGGV
ncbi:MAG TPA: hypothetical protein VK905_01250 [Bacillota bacterium]|nr:hypothetical protein [Bacillota bacterium]